MYFVQSEVLLKGTCSVSGDLHSVYSVRTVKTGFLNPIWIQEERGCLGLGSIHFHPTCHGQAIAERLFVFHSCVHHYYLILRKAIILLRRNAMFHIFLQFLSNAYEERVHVPKSH